MSKPDIQAGVAEGQRRRAERTAITQDGVIQTLARIAFSDVRNLFDRRGQLLSLSVLSPEVSAGIASMTVEQPKGSNGAVVRIRMHDKLRALELLAKHLGMFRDPKSTAPPAVTIDASKVASMTDEELDRGLANVDKLIAAVTKTAA